jgi:hypothetical protein
MELSTETLKKLSEYEAETLRGRGGMNGDCRDYCDGAYMVLCALITRDAPGTGGPITNCECFDSYYTCWGWAIR